MRGLRAGSSVWELRQDCMKIHKVLVLAPPLTAVGGVQNYTKALVRALEELLGPDRVRLVAVSREPEARHGGNPRLRLSVKLRFALSAFATALRWRPDLIICAHIGVAPVGNLIRKLTRTPYWLVLYGIEVWGDLPEGNRNALRAAQRHVAITRFTLDATIARHGIQRCRELILPPTLPKMRPRLQEASSVTLQGSLRPMVLTVGRIAASERYKGHDVMLDAWPAILQRVPDAVYWIVGGGDDRPRLEARARELGIADSVHFTGPLSPEQLDACYDRCCVFAMPARIELDARVPRGEGFGIVFLEAMAHGKPVVGPSVGAPAEFIRSGVHGALVDPTDSRAVAAAVIELLEDPVRARRMGDAGKSWVESEFSFDRFCERLRDAL